MPIDDPVAWWRLDDSSGAEAADSSGNGYDLTLSNSPAWISDGQISGALNFVGASSQKGETNAAALLARLQGSSAFTVAFWARTAAYADAKAAFTIRNGTDVNALLVVYPYDTSGGNGARAYLNGDIIDQNSGAATVNEWHHFVFLSRSAADRELFVDNASVGTSTASQTIPATLSHVGIGAWDGGQFFTGDLDDVRIYDRALTAGDIAELFAWPPPPSPLRAIDTDGGSGRSPQSKALPYWWQSYLAQWLAELEEREAEYQRIKAEQDAKAAAERFQQFMLNRAARRAEEQRQAAEAAARQREIDAALAQRLAAIQREKDERLAQEQARIDAAKQRVKDRQEAARLAAEAAEMEALRGAARNRRRRFSDRFEAAIEAARRQGWRAKLN